MARAALGNRRCVLGSALAGVAVMAITHDWLTPTETKDATETQFIDRLLEGWAKWSRNTGIDQRPTAAGDLWQIQAIIELGDYVLELTDENFVIVDQKVAVLPRRLHAIVFVEYLGPGPSSKQRAERIGLTYLAYRQRLHAAHWTLYASLSPHIERLRQNATVNAIKNAARFRSRGLV
jgi:hypothetical protein